MDNTEYKKQIDDLERALRTPRDLTNCVPEDQASILALHFIGYIAKPTGISDDLYRRCIQAFNDHRGKVEWEIEAILKVLKQEKKQ